MPALIARGEAMLAARFAGARLFAFGHIGDGNLHFNVRPPVGEGDAWVDAHRDAVAHAVDDLVHDLGGSIAAEHGVGAMKMAELARLGDPGRLAMMRAVKAALDPKGIMNPGRVVTLS